MNVWAMKTWKPGLKHGHSFGKCNRRDRYHYLKLFFLVEPCLSYILSFKGMTMRKLFRISFLFVLSQLLYKTVTQQCRSEVSIFGWMLQGHIYSTVLAELPHTCVQVCWKTIDAKALIGWSLSLSASLVTELRKPDLRISFQIQTDFTTNVIAAEVKNSLQFIINNCDDWSMLIKVEAIVSS